MSRKINGQTMKDWLLEFLDQRYPDRDDLNRPDARAAAFAQMPGGFRPSTDRLTLAWFTKTFNAILNDNGWGFVDGRSGDRVVRQLALEWSDFRPLLVGKLVLVKDDVDAVRADLEAWAEANEPGMNIDATMTELKSAAGL